MPRPKKNLQTAQHQGQYCKSTDNVENSKVQAIKSNQLVNIMASKCRYLAQLITNPCEIHEALMHELWEQKIIDRLFKYPHIPGAKLFNKISTECWNQIYLQKQQNDAHFRNSELDGQSIENEIRKIGDEIKEIEVMTNMNYSI